MNQTDTRDPEQSDPVAALGHAINEGCVLHGPDGSDLDATVKCAPGTLDSLAEQGYVLVNEKRLAAALRKHDEEWGKHEHCRHAVAILATIQEQERAD